MVEGHARGSTLYTPPILSLPQSVKDMITTTSLAHFETLELGSHRRFNKLFETINKLFETSTLHAVA